MQFGCTWERPQTSWENTAKFVEAIFASLRAVHPTFNTWYHKANSRADANKPVDLSLAGMKEMVDQGLYRTDFGNEIMPTLGTKFAAWSPETPERSIELKLNSAPEEVGTNFVRLKLIADLPSGELPFPPEVCTELLTELIKVTTPDRATLSCRAWQFALPHPAYSRSAGWLTYIPRSIDEVQLPEGATAQALLDGTLITAAPQPEHVTQETLNTIWELTQV